MVVVSSDHHVSFFGKEFFFFLTPKKPEEEFTQREGVWKLQNDATKETFPDKNGLVVTKCTVNI